jgi:hypothetical protein
MMAKEDPLPGGGRRAEMYWGAGLLQAGVAGA